MTVRTRKNMKLQGTGYWIAGVLAVRIIEALDHLSREHAICDGFAARGESAGRGTSESSTTEAAMLARHQLELKADNITDAIEGITISANHLDRCIKEALKTRTADPTVKVARCSDNQVGREGAIVWGDPTCKALPEKAGYCSACYQRERRWRITQNMPARDIEEAPDKDWVGAGKPYHARTHQTEIAS